MLTKLKAWFNKSDTASRRNRDMADEEIIQTPDAAVDPEPAPPVSPEEVPAEAETPEQTPETPVEVHNMTFEEFKSDFVSFRETLDEKHQTMKDKEAKILAAYAEIEAMLDAKMVELDDFKAKYLS